MTNLFPLMASGVLGISILICRGENKSFPNGTVPTDAYDEPGMPVYFDEHFNIVGVDFLRWSNLNWRGNVYSAWMGLKFSGFSWFKVRF